MQLAPAKRANGDKSPPAGVCSMTKGACDLTKGVAEVGNLSAVWTTTCIGTSTSAFPLSALHEGTHVLTPTLFVGAAADARLGLA